MIEIEERVVKLNSTIVISRRVEIQEVARQISKEVFSGDTISEAIELTRQVLPEIILIDHWSDSKEIIFFLNAIKSISKIPVVIVRDEHRNANIDGNVIENESVHYLKIPEDSYRLNGLVRQILRKGDCQPDRLNEDVCSRFYHDEFAAATAIVGRSTSIVHTLRMIKLIASSQCNPILIVGEMGSGKELAARAIHTLRCPDKEFIAVNCASLSANLLESELFGHEKGAFTSADREKTGLLELAGDGCIFLDEISEMPMELQAKILRVIQEKTFRKVGGTREMICRATIIASSNRDLKKEVQANRFRGDLYHRLSIFPIVLSPLRLDNRREDIKLLAEYFLQASTICPEKSGKIASITKLALEALEGHNWPGNIRELRNVIDRAILLESTDKISLNSIIINPEDPEEFFNNKSDQKIQDFSLAKAEQELIARVLQETNWQKTKAAELLGISRATLYAKVKQHNLEMNSSFSNNEAGDSAEEFLANGVA